MYFFKNKIRSQTRFFLLFRIQGKVLNAGRWGIWMISFLIASNAQGLEVPKKIAGLDLVSGKSTTQVIQEAKRATVVVFLSTRCPCSASHQGALNGLYEEFFSKGFQWVGVHSNANESVAEAKSFFSQSGLRFPVIQDQGSVVADQFEAVKTPHVFVLSPEGEILFRGGVDDSKVSNRAKKFYLREALSEIEKGRAPREKEVRVLGCQIQRPE